MRIATDSHKLTWPATLGAIHDGERTRFRVWAPDAGRVAVVVEGGPTFPMARDATGQFFEGEAPVGAGARYRYRVDGQGPFPDPASRFQPDGVHQASEVVDPSSFPWTDQGWSGPDRDRLIIYELHVGTFTEEGTFDAATDRLGDLADLGINAVQLLPVNDFPGRWNWGYDGVSLFAPARSYGRPDDLRRLVDHAHALGMAVLLDVVYNHFGPDGNSTGAFSSRYVRADRVTNWGPAINIGGEGSEHVRAFFIENARMWVHEYHIDGFRLDATHAFVDDGPRPFLLEFSEQVRASCPDRPLVLIAEDHRNLDLIIKPRDQGGWGLDGVWSDDFHHQIRRYLTGDSDGIFQDFRGSMADLATTVERGWLFTGEYSAYREKNRGTDPSGLAPPRFVFCLQNHDRVGNRGKGDRLSHGVDLATYRAATVALLMAPETPMLFQGQEWAASTPFFYFTDHHAELGKAVREGRGREFRKYDDFNTPEKLAMVPDPQAESTFLASRLEHEEKGLEPHTSTLRLHRALIRLRREEPAFGGLEHECIAINQDVMMIRLESSRNRLVAIIRLKGSGSVTIEESVAASEVVLSTEDPRFATDPMPIKFGESRIDFPRPGAVVFRSGA